MSYLSFQDQSSQVGGAAFQNITDALDPAPQVVPKQHFVEWFSGDAIDTIWKVAHFGSGSSGMDDSVNGGFQMTTGAISTNFSTLDMNTISHYDFDGSVAISVIKIDTTSSIFSSYYGLSNGGAFQAHILASVKDSQSNYYLSNRASATTETVSSIAKDTSYHKHKVESTVASCRYHIDDTLEAISTTNLPDDKMQPFIQHRTSEDVAKTLNILYYEAFNT